MVEKHPQEGHADPNGSYDREIDVKTIVVFSAALVGTTLVVLLLMWWMSATFKSQEEASDPPLSPMAEARQDPIPPGPRLQSAPPRDMDELRAQDREALTTYGWVDRPGAIARIPVSRAISLLVEKGLPKTFPPPLAPQAAAGETAPPQVAPLHAAAAQAVPPHAAPPEKKPARGKKDAK